MTAFRNWYDAVAAIALQDPDRIAMSDGDRTLSYGELVARAVRLAAWLYDRGLRPGDRLGIHLRKSFEENIATLAAVRLGLVFVHIHPQRTASQINEVIVDSGLRLLFTEPRRALEIANDPTLGEATPELVTVGEDPPAGAVAWPSLESLESLELEREPPVGSPDADQLAALMYTSGSTGFPKGVMHSHGNLMAFAANVAEYLRAVETDRVLGLLPVSFSYGLNQLLTTLYVGGHLVLHKAPFPADIVRTLSEKRITGFAAVPSLWSQILDYLDKEPTSLPALRYVTNASDALGKRNARRLRRHIPGADLILMYGSTEVLRSTYLPPELLDRKAGAIGKAIPNVEVFVVGEDGQLRGPGEQGELVQRGAQVSQGYWNNPEETSRRFRVCAALPGPDKLAYHSGDIVRIDAEGVHWFVSRVGWMVKSGGFRFSIEEVERLLRESELVGDAAAFALPDESKGQVVEVAVTSKTGAPLDRAELERYCYRAMPSHMLPRAFHLVAQIPLLPNGKRDREALRSQLAASESSAPAGRTRAPSPVRDAC